MDQVLIGRADPYDLETAKATIAGYCFSNREVEVGGSFGLERRPISVPSWAYRIYDCIPPDPGPHFSDLDIFVVNGLNARMGMRGAAAIQAVADQVGEHLSAIDEDAAFWDMERDDLKDPESANRGSDGWHLQQAWALLVSLPAVGPAVAHKLLHHKRPTQFPLLDNETLPFLREREWQQIHDDVNTEPFSELESWFVEESRAQEGQNPLLKRLRLHDILLWCEAAGDRGRASQVGRQVRRV